MSAAIGWNRRMHPSTNDRLPLLDPVSSLAPHSPRSPFKTYQGTAHAVPASAVAAHSARSRADAEQHGLLSILDFSRPTGCEVYSDACSLLQGFDAAPSHLYQGSGGRHVDAFFSAGVRERALLFLLALAVSAHELPILAMWWESLGTRRIGERSVFMTDFCFLVGQQS